MEFYKSKTANYFLQDTAIENLFIGEYMLDAPENFVKVYLLGKMYAEQGIGSDSDAIAKKLSVDPKVVDDAWTYWESKAMVKKISEGNGKNAIQFVNLKEAVFGHCQAEGLKETVKVEGEEIGKLFSSIEQICKRTLEAREPEIVASWVEEFGIKPEVILACYRYCTDRASSNRVKYVEAIIRDWNERGLKSAEDVEEYLSENDKLYELYKRVFRELGFTRNASIPEKRIMRTWFLDMEFSLDEVLEACKKTTGISSPNINYVDSILNAKFKEKHKDAQEISTEDALSKVERRYQALQKENAEKTKELREKIYDQLPSLKDISDSISSAQYALTKATLAGATIAKKEARDRLLQLNKEKADLLCINGYREDALDAIYTCKQCQDTGLREDGSRCSCYADRLKEV